MFMFNSNEPIKVAHRQKLANQSLLNDALAMEIVNNSFRESKNIRELSSLASLVKARKTLVV